MRKTKRKYVKEHAEFCVYLRKLRQNYGYTQTDIAKTLNLSRSQYTALENGRSMLTFEQLCGLAGHYKLELFELTAEKY